MRARHTAKALRDRDGRRTAVDALSGRTVQLVSAIGNPEAFEADVRRLGAEIGEHRVFADHHAYVARDLEGLGGESGFVLTTAKDAVKLDALGVPFHTLEVELEIVSGAQVLEALLDALPIGDVGETYGQARGWRDGSLD